MKKKIYLVVPHDTNFWEDGDFEYLELGFAPNLDHYNQYPSREKALRVAKPRDEIISITFKTVRGK